MGEDWEAALQLTTVVQFMSLTPVLRHDKAFRPIRNTDQTISVRVRRDFIGYTNPSH